MVINPFQIDKIHGLDGWIVKFSIDFYYIIGDYLLQAVEEMRLNGNIRGSINSNILTLIPKVDCLNSYNDFQLISVCNCIDNIKSKVIVFSYQPITIQDYLL